MNDGTGFDILELLDEIRFKVIFTTASDEYAIKAFKFSATDYLLKPIESEELIKAVNKASQLMDSGREHVDLLMDQMRKGEEITKIALHTAEKIQVVELKDIIRCESNVNYTVFYFKSGEKLLVTKTLKFYDQLLSPSGFLRVHQSHLINVSHIHEYVKADGGYIIMANQENVPISARKKAEVIELISSIR
jgi:two-component system LytT family response regulator